jgi:hypothetical protein
MDSPHEIPNEQLRREHLPGPDDDQFAWIQFALTFDGYADKGNHEECAAFANSARHRWEQDGTLPVGLSDLRTALFFEQRRWRWSNEDPFNREEWRYWAALVNAIGRVLSGNDESEFLEIIPSILHASDPDSAEAPDMAEKVYHADQDRMAQSPAIEAAAGQIERAIGLYSEVDAHGGSRNVWLRLTKEGRLILEGQDLGGSVVKAFGTREYEWTWSLAPEQVNDLLTRLHLEPPQSTDLLDFVADALKKLEKNEVDKFFEDAGAAFWNRMGD